MTQDDDLKFRDIAANFAAGEADELVDRFVKRAQDWEEAFRASAGVEPTQYDLTRQLLAEPSNDMMIRIALAAMMWKRMHP